MDSRPGGLKRKFQTSLTNKTILIHIMKLRVLKSHMARALLWYTNQLYNTHLGKLMTPANVELLRRDLEQLQVLMQNRESNSIWRVPVGILVDNTRNIFEVVVTDESNVLYVHENS